MPPAKKVPQPLELWDQGSNKHTRICNFTRKGKRRKKKKRKERSKKGLKRKERERTGQKES